MKTTRSFLFFACIFCWNSALALSNWDPGAWKPHAEFPDLAPKTELDLENKVLRIASSGEFRCNGSWRNWFSVRQATYYRVSAEYLAQNVALPRRSILVKVDWRGVGGDRIGQPDYLEESGADGLEGWETLSGTFQVPEGANSAVVDLIFRWDESGHVKWRNVSIREVPKPQSREVVLATVRFRPNESSGPEENLRLFASFVEKAAAKGADIVCFPEGITLVATSKTYREVAESVPGPTTAFLGEYARRYSVYLVAGLLEKTPEAVYNTAVLIDRDGKLAGRYRKASLPREEIEGGITPGQEFPVFETDFGKIGMMICWDVQFVEPARRLAAKGAEIILLPIWGGSPELFPARTIENQVYLVTSSYDTRTGIWGPRGNVLAEAEQEGTIAVAKVDLAKRIQWEWLGNLRSRIAKEAPKTEEVP